MFLSPMRLSRNLLPLLALLLLSVNGFGQTPRVFLKFDGNLTDSSGAGIITTVAPNSGFTPTYNTDRFNVASKAIVFTGGQSLLLYASSAIGNSNQALGLRNGGANTSFTLTG